MKRLGVILLYAVGGYLCSAVVGYFLVSLLSSNMHDRSVEAGPLGGLVAIVVGVIRSGRRRAATTR
jgi:hypothetical protein